MLKLLVSVSLVSTTKLLATQYRLATGNQDRVVVQVGLDADYERRGSVAEHFDVI